MTVDQIDEALTEMYDADKIHQHNKEVIAWCHLVKLVIFTGEVRENAIDIRKRQVRYLYEIMRTTFCENMIKNMPENWDTDEVPTKFMKMMYNGYRRYCKRHPQPAYFADTSSTDNEDLKPEFRFANKEIHPDDVVAWRKNKDVF